MLIKVTAKHIKDGVPGVSDKCPIALALKSAGFDRVFIGSLISRIDGKDYSLGNKVTDFIELFDDGMKLNPFEFDIGRHK